MTTDARLVGILSDAHAQVNSLIGALAEQHQALNNERGSIWSWWKGFAAQRAESELRGVQNGAFAQAIELLIALRSDLAGQAQQVQNQLDREAEERRRLLAAEAAQQAAQTRSPGVVP